MVRSRLRPQAPAERRTEDLSGRLVTVRNPNDAATEAYRALRTNFLYALKDVLFRAIVVTSPGPTEGKSTTCANLGGVLAEADKNTLILECDFRKPVMHRIFGLPNFLGVADVLAGRNSLQEIWQEPLPGLKVAVGGPIPPNPAELLSSQRFAELLNRSRQEFDYVLIDVPPTQTVSDSVIVSAQGDSVLLVIDAQNTRKVSVRQSIRTLEAAGANVLGTVMSNVDTSQIGYHRYGYTYR